MGEYSPPHPDTPPKIEGTTEKQRKPEKPEKTEEKCSKLSELPENLFFELLIWNQFFNRFSIIF